MREGKRLGRELVAGGGAVGVATACTNPVDVVKVRCQLHTMRGHTSFRNTLVTIVTNEGVRGLSGGLAAAVARGVTYGGVRLGMYGPVKPLFGADKEDAGLGSKIAASVFTGATAAAMTNPMDLIKTKGQMQARDPSTGTGQRPSVILGTVLREEGVRGLWKGTVPGATRASILTASQLVTYSEVKAHVLCYLDDGFLAHLCTSMVTGFVATTTTNPVDVIKTRVYAARKAANGEAGILTQVGGIVKNEGLGGFLKGWTASYLRLGPQTAITFLVYEQVRKVVGLDAL